MFALSPRSRLGAATVAAVAFSLPFHAVGHAHAEPHAAAAIWRPWIELGGYYGNLRTRGEAALWVPFWQTHDALVFADLRGKLFDESAEEGNAALGYRQMVGDFNLGIWAGYDVRRSRFDNRFHQLAGGFEALSRTIDLRLNYYLPINRSEIIDQSISTRTTTESLTGLSTDNGSLSVFNTLTTTTDTTMHTLREHALFGVDGEIGLQLPLDRALAGSGIETSRLPDIKLYAGAYYFDSKDIDEKLLGPRLRLEARWDDIIPSLPGSALTAEAEYQYDRVRDHQVEAGLRLRIPLGGPAGRATDSPRPSYQARRMVAALERDTDIVRQAKATTSNAKTTTVETSIEAVVDTTTGRKLDRYTVVDANQHLGRTMAAAGDNAVVIASGTAGAFVDDKVRMMPGQALIGGGTMLTLKTEKSGRVFQFAAPGLRPTLVQTTNDPVLVVANNTYVTGIDIKGGGLVAGIDNDGIATPGKGISGFRIDDVSVTNTGGSGLRVHSYVTNWQLTGSRLTDIPGGAGISIENSNRDFAISNVHIAGITLRSGDALHLSAANVGTIENSTFGPGIADHVLRLRDANVLSGQGNVNMSGRPLCQQFGTGNTVEVSFDGNSGCR